LRHIIAAIVNQEGNEKKFYWTGAGISQDPDMAYEFLSRYSAKNSLARIQQLHLAGSVIVDGKEEFLNFNIEKRQ